MPIVNPNLYSVNNNIYQKKADRFLWQALKDAPSVLPILSPLIVAFSYIHLILYYRNFGINAFQYLTATDVITESVKFIMLYSCIMWIIISINISPYHKKTFDLIAAFPLRKVSMLNRIKFLLKHSEFYIKVHIMFIIIFAIFFDDGFTREYLFFIISYWTIYLLFTTGSIHIYISRKWLVIFNVLLAANLAEMTANSSKHDELLDSGSAKTIIIKVDNNILKIREGSDTVLIGITSENVLFRARAANSNIIYPKSVVLSIVERPMVPAPFWQLVDYVKDRI